MPWLVVGFLSLIGLALWSRQSSAAPSSPTLPPAPTPTPTPTTPPLTPAQTPVWAPVTPTQAATGASASIPANATFAVSLPSTDPQAPSIVASLQQGAAPIGTQITALQVYQPGSSPPAGWPSDGLGTSAYRVTGVVGAAPLTLVFDQSMQAWTFAGVVSGG
jgi:hypothetical protein